MKLKFILLIILLIPILVIAEECDVSKILITSIEQVDINGDTEVLSEPKIEDKTIKFNLRMYEVGDSISYNLVIKNDSDEDYIIDDDSFSIDSDYIEYIVTSDNNIIKAKSIKNVLFKINYSNEVDSSLLNNNRFNSFINTNLRMNTLDKENSIIDSNNKEDTSNNDKNKEGVKNPITSIFSIKILIITLLVAFAIAYLTITNRKKYNKYIVLIYSLLYIPFIYAICISNYVIDNEVEIVKYEDLYSFFRGGINDDIPPSVYDNYEDVMNDYGYDFFLRFRTVDSIVKRLSIGFIIDDELYYINGGEGSKYFESNKKLLLDVFGEDNCYINDEEQFMCSNDLYDVRNYDYGFISIGSKIPGKLYFCMIYEYGRSLCVND